MTETFNPGPDAVEIIEREECFRGFYRLDRFHPVSYTHLTLPTKA